MRAKHQARNETVLAYAICAEIGNKEYLPPQIGVVFQQDAEALMASPDKFPDGANSLLDPTLQESYPFPTGTSYPYISVESAQGEDWEWETSTMAKGLSNLVDGMNRLRKPGEPPFVLVDLEDDPARYLDQLDRPDRDTLAQYGLVKIAPIHPERA